VAPLSVLYLGGFFASTMPYGVFRVLMATAFLGGAAMVMRELARAERLLGLRVTAGLLTCLVYGLAGIGMVAFNSTCHPSEVELRTLWLEPPVPSAAVRDGCEDGGT
jgi:hypothetical protein